MMSLPITNENRQAWNPGGLCDAVQKGYSSDSYPVLVKSECSSREREGESGILSIEIRFVPRERA